MNDLARLSRSQRAGKALLRPRPPRRPSQSRHSGHRPHASQHYFAFLSYSHADEQVAAWLHEGIEQFRVPRRLVGRLTENGPIPRRLQPIFRDRGDLAASGDLSAEIEEALIGSRFLIVLCSPAAVRSRWVNLEIETFKRFHPDGCVIAAIVDGEPFASDIPGRETEECFPDALRVRYDQRGRPTSRRAEPIAADLREHRDGRQGGLLKIIAGMLGVGLDDLVQREAHRRHKRLALLAAASFAGMAATSGLAVFAFEARDDAREERREAEGLISFMLGDLRKKLEPIGKLEALDSVGARALAYYERQDKANLSDAALVQRSRALTLMGEIAQLRGDLDGALRRYREAMSGTAEMVRRAPNDPQNLFGHAQNVFWVGNIAYQRGDMERAAAAFREYRRLADGMIALAPANTDYQMERIYADTNLGTVLMAQRRYRAAATIYQGLLESAEMLVAKQPQNVEYQQQLVSALAWLADAREFSGHLDEALGLRTRELELLQSLWQSSKGDTRAKRKEMTSRRALARLLASRGDLVQALEQSHEAAAAIDWLMRTEPENTEWIQAGARANFERARIELSANRLAEARAATQAACDASGRLIARDRSVAAWRTTLRLDCLIGRATVALRAGKSGEAVSWAQQAVVLARTEAQPLERALATATAEMMLGDALMQSGHAGAARGAFERALSAWPKSVEKKPSELAQHARLLRRLGRNAEAQPMIKQLAAMGYRHPEFRT
jgi:tetratricopeptide (TPR) repeat protein